VVRVRIPPYPHTPLGRCARPLKGDRARALVRGFRVGGEASEIGENGNATRRPRAPQKILASLSPTGLMITSLVVALSDLTEANVSE
jgi:hypothetical protein